MIDDQDKGQKVPFEFPLRRPNEWFCQYGAVGGRNTSRDILPVWEWTSFRHYIPVPMDGRVWGRKKMCHFMMRWAWWKWYIQVGWCYAAPARHPDDESPDRRKAERRQVDDGPPPATPVSQPPASSS